MPVSTEIKSNRVGKEGRRRERKQRKSEKWRSMRNGIEKSVTMKRSTKALFSVPCTVHM